MAEGPYVSQADQETPAPWPAGPADRDPPGQPAYPLSAVGPPDADARTWALFAHLSALCVFVGIPNVVGPLVVWLLGRGRHPFIDDQGKEALNFHITLLMAAVLAFAAMFVLGVLTLGLGFLVLWLLPAAVYVYGLVMTIVGAAQANQGIWFRYPVALRFIR